MLLLVVILAPYTNAVTGTGDDNIIDIVTGTVTFTCTITNINAGTVSRAGTGTSDGTIKILVLSGD